MDRTKLIVWNIRQTQYTYVTFLLQWLYASSIDNDSLSIWVSFRFFDFLNLLSVFCVFYLFFSFFCIDHIFHHWKIMFYTMIGVNMGQVLIIIILLVLTYTICTRRADTFKTFLVVGHTIAHNCIIGIIANISFWGFVISGWQIVPSYLSSDISFLAWLVLFINKDISVLILHWSLEWVLMMCRHTSQLSHHYDYPMLNNVVPQFPLQYPTNKTK